MSDNSVQIRKLHKSDFQSLVKLYEIVWPEVDYNKQDKANFIVNQSKGINYCAEIDGIIVGSRTSFCQNMYYGDRSLNCVQIGDSCTHPSYRGQGLFLKMNKAFLSDFFSDQNKGELIFNISVLASRRAYEKLGWKYIESLMALRQFSRPLHIVWKTKMNLKKLSVPVKWDKINDEIKLEEELLQKREELLRDRNLLHICYNEETLNWRMKSRSGIRQFNLDGVGSILFKRGVRGNIVDVEIGEVFLYDYCQKQLKVLLREFKKKYTPDILTILVSEGHPLRKMYKSLGFCCNPRQKYLHHGVRVETDEMKKICYEPYNWALTSLDIDTF